jgi:hypothetical protein
MSERLLRLPEGISRIDDIRALLEQPREGVQEALSVKEA